MRIKTIVLVLIVIAILPIVLADGDVEENLIPEIYQQGTSVDIRESCTNAGSFCSGNATCNITIFSPHNFLLINNQPMTNQNSYHNYTLNTSQTTELGQYRYNILCVDGGDKGIDSFIMEITPSGTQPSTAQGMIYVIVLAISAIMFGVVLWIATGMDGENKFNEKGIVTLINIKKYVKFGLYVMAYLLIVWLSFLAWKASENFLFLDFMITFFRWSTLLLLTIGAPLFFIRIKEAHP